jgi:hypothetical protein
MDTFSVNNLDIDNPFRNSGSIIYEINNYLVVIGKKTSIYIGNTMDTITINNIQLSEELSMKLKYLLGTLNFFNEVLSKKIFEGTNGHLFFIKNIDILVGLIYRLENEKNILYLEKIIDEMNNKRIDLRKEFYYESLCDRFS